MSLSLSLVNIQTLSQLSKKEKKARKRSARDNLREKVHLILHSGKSWRGNPGGPQDLQRSYFVMRPLPAGGKSPTVLLRM